MDSRKACLSLLLIAIVFPSLAIATVTLPLPWKIGDSHRYQSVVVQEKTRAGKMQRIETHEVDSIKIVEAGPKGFLQAWHTDSSRVAISGDAGSSDAEKEMVSQLQDRFRDLALEAELEPDGAYRRLRNWKVLGGAMREVMLPVMVKQARSRPELAKADEAGLREKFVPALERMTNEQAISNTLGKNIAIFNFFTAASLKPGEPRVYEDYLPSPWSADLIPTKGSFRLAGTDDRAGTVTIEWKQEIDPVKAAPIMWKIVESLMGQPVSDKNKQALPEGFILTDQATVVVDRKSGLPLKLSHQRRVEAGTARNVSTWKLDKLPD